MKKNITLEESMNITGLGDFEKKIRAVSEMTSSERVFLHSVITHFRPRKLLEVGVAAGGSSALMLNSIKDLPDAKLISHDYCTDYYRDQAQKSGFVVNDVCPELTDKWELLTGGSIAEHMEKIGGEIDFLLLDTMHSNPGEFLDFLIILPYLAKNAIVVIHDISLHMGSQRWCLKATTCGVLFAALKGAKATPDDLSNNFRHPHTMDGFTFANIGSVILDDNTRCSMDDYFHLLTLPWAYSLNTHDLNTIYKYFETHYDKHYADIFLTCSDHFSKILDSERLNSMGDVLNKQDVPIRSRDAEPRKLIRLLNFLCDQKTTNRKITVFRLFGVFPFMLIFRK